MWRDTESDEFSSEDPNISVLPDFFKSSGRSQLSKLMFVLLPESAWRSISFSSFGMFLTAYSILMNVLILIKKYIHFAMLQDTAIAKNNSGRIDIHVCQQLYPLGVGFGQFQFVWFEYICRDKYHIEQKRDALII